VESIDLKGMFDSSFGGLCTIIAFRQFCFFFFLGQHFDRPNAEIIGEIIMNNTSLIQLNLEYTLLTDEVCLFQSQLFPLILLNLSFTIYSC